MVGEVNYLIISFCTNNNIDINKTTINPLYNIKFKIVI